MSIHDPQSIPDPGEGSGRDGQRIVWACACGSGLNVHSNAPGRQTLRGWLAVHRRDPRDPSLPPRTCPRETCTVTTTHIHLTDPITVQWAPRSSHEHPAHH